MGRGFPYDHVNASTIILQQCIFNLVGMKHLSAWHEDFDSVFSDTVSGSP